MRSSFRATYDGAPPRSSGTQAPRRAGLAVGPRRATRSASGNSCSYATFARYASMRRSNSSMVAVPGTSKKTSRTVDGPLDAKGRAVSIQQLDSAQVATHALIQQCHEQELDDGVGDRTSILLHDLLFMRNFVNDRLDVLGAQWPALPISRYLVAPN